MVLNRFRALLRDKFYRVVAQAVQDSGIPGRQEQIAQRVDQLAADFAAYEHRIRRDIDYAGQIESAREASAYALEHMQHAARFPHPHDTLRFGLDLAPNDGLCLEFGVAAGHTLRTIAERKPAGTVFGFDSFQGFPEDWRTGFPQGTFAMPPPEVPGAELVVGWFEETLPEFLEKHPERIAFVHADADLYSSTLIILNCLEERLQPGTVIVFDEFFNYPGWRDHEFKAWEEFVTRTGIAFAYEAYTADHEQVVVRIR